MEKFEIIPVTAPPGSDDYLPCEEADATHWAVMLDENTRIIHATREDAEADAARLSRSDRFVWSPDDVEHH